MVEIIIRKITIYQHNYDWYSSYISTNMKVMINSWKYTMFKSFLF